MGEQANTQMFNYGGKMDCLRNLDEMSFKKLCREKGLTETEIIIADLYIRQEMKCDDIAKIVGYSLPTIWQKRALIKRCLGLL